MNRYPDNKLVILATGAQGEEFAALGRIANKTHKFIRLTPRDTILMSSSFGPFVYGLIDIINNSIENEYYVNGYAMKIEK
jgi:ribonuclease J